VNAPRLFELPPLPDRDEPEPDAPGYSALGHAAEQVLIARLIQMGHRVAVPVVDDDGVDMIVNYDLKIQVKSSGSRSPAGMLLVCLNGRRFRERGDRGFLRPHVDIVAVHARDTQAWWFLPRNGIIGARQNIALSEYGRHSTWHEAWEVFAPGWAATA
jgi:PD-(D/E)XK endonuclease